MDLKIACKAYLFEMQISQLKKVQSKVSVLSLQSGIAYPSTQPFRQNPVTCSHTFPALHLPHGCRKQNVVRIQE